MQNSGTSTSPAGAAVQMAPVTTTSLVVIGLAIVATLLMIWWGTRLWRARRDAIATLEDEGRLDRVADAPAPAPPPSPARRAAAEHPGDVALASAPSTEAMPVVAPTAPSPPPLADSPTVAAASAAPIAPPPTGGDDLTLLKGVGPKVAAQLSEHGITRFADLAALSPADAEALDAQLGNFRGRMFRDRWIDQARYLAEGDRAGFEAAFGKL
ncbi:hypothetical protein [Sphingomonas japonica]|uniref:Flap endonuclease-1-like 5' DNA nuclease n=1 Tax=Sphingomonas japonica TaxID=511662 RepID=A0ABX0U2D8_9SPHN|nr:hypothetical protein [Sphingomonas japonica]NIJ23884.1 putative flap endonuclease-1-like 5' DNA nuclease [Sphingomonas japonica]